MSWKRADRGPSGKLDGSQVRREYVVEGERYKPPDAGGVGPEDLAIRYRAVLDGIERCLSWCPKSQRVLKTHLQQSWVEASRLLHSLPSVPETQNVFEL